MIRLLGLFLVAIAACAITVNAQADEPKKETKKVEETKKETVKETKKAEAIKYEGKITCAKCDLKEEGRTACQACIVVKEKDKDVVYYFDKAAHGKYHGDICKTPKEGYVSGTAVKGKDDKYTITVKELEYKK